MPARSRALPRRECDLYEPVKAFLQAQGYEVKAEVAGCDVVGTRGADPPVIVELKLTFNLALVLQGVDRLALTDHVYLAVRRPGAGRPVGPSVNRPDVRRLCRRLGLGLMAVAPDGGVDVLLDPLPYRPRRSARRLGRLLREHTQRAGDPNRGGITRAPIVTAYRQEALRCALLLQDSCPGTLGALRETGRPRAQRPPHPPARRLRLVRARRAGDLPPHRARARGHGALRGRGPPPRARLGAGSRPPGSAEPRVGPCVAPGVPAIDSDRHR